MYILIIVFLSYNIFIINMFICTLIKDKIMHMDSNFTGYACMCACEDIYIMRAAV